MSTDIFPFAVWLAGTNQNSIPANDNALRVEVITGPAQSIRSAQPVTPAENDQHILGASPTGAQWASFTAGDVVIFKGGTWLAFAPYSGWIKFIESDDVNYQWNGAWAPFAGGGGGASDFTDLDDVPSSYTGSANKLVAVNGAGTALVFVDPPTGGGINPQTGTTYTLVVADAGKTVTMANSAANVLTVPPNSSVSMPIGAQIGVMMNGVGQTSVAAGAGVMVNTIESLQLLRAGAVAVLEQTAVDVWRLTGELRPPVPVYRSRQRFDPSNGTSAGTTLGVAFTSAGTVSHQALSTSSVQSVLRRTRWATTAAAGNAAGIYETAVTKVRGNAVGIGGFFAEFTFTQATNINGHQAFVGLAASTATLGGEPSALVNMIGMGYDSTDGSTGNWQLMRNDGTGAATKVDLGTNAARNTTDVYVLTIRSPQNGADVFVKVVNLSTGVTVLDTSYNADLPANTVFLGLRAQNRTGATTTAGLMEVATIDVGYQE